MFTCFTIHVLHVLYRIHFHTGWSNKYWSRRKNVWNIWYVSYHKIYFNKMPHLMQFSKLHVNRARYSVCCWITIAQNVQEIPWASQQKLPHNRFLESTERNKVLTDCYFFACLVFFPYDVNVFVTDLTVDHVVTHVQGFSSVFLMILCKKLCQIWRNLE